MNELNNGCYMTVLENENYIDFCNSVIRKLTQVWAFKTNNVLACARKHMENEDRQRLVP